jgi:hypothetical protein
VKYEDVVSLALAKDFSGLMSADREKEEIFFRKPCTNKKNAYFCTRFETQAVLNTKTRS